jgi:hypothetical protein
MCAPDAVAVPNRGQRRMIAPAGRLGSVSPPDAIGQFLADRSGGHSTKALREDWIGGGGVEIAWFPFFSF